jgi:hypothetical protein
MHNAGELDGMISKDLAGDLKINLEINLRKAGLTEEKINEIISAPIGERPNPASYLPQEYIDAHLEKFDEGATKFVAKIYGNGYIGPRGGTYVIPKQVADELVEQSGGDVSKLEELLGLNPGTLGEHPIRVDVETPNGLEMPQGNEPGTNINWLPGGYTSGGLPEARVDQIPPGDYTITYLN